MHAQAEAIRVAAYEAIRHKKRIWRGAQKHLLES